MSRGSGAHGRIHAPDLTIRSELLVATNIVLIEHARSTDELSLDCRERIPTRNLVSASLTAGLLITGEAVTPPCVARPGAFSLLVFVASVVGVPEFQRALPRVDPEGGSPQAGCSELAD